MYMGIFAKVCLCIMCVHTVAKKEDTRSLRAEITDKCGCLKSNPGPLKEVLITLSALQPRVSGFVGH